MPIYEYRCDNEHLFEALQKFSDDPLSECEQCGAPVERVLHPVSVHFKGSGFYATDYAGKKDGKPADKNEGQSGGKDSEKDKSGSEKDSKSESKSGSDKGSKDQSCSSADSVATTAS